MLAIVATAPGEFPVPAHQGVRGDQEASPTRPREPSTECREDRPVDGLVADTSVELPLEDAHLVAEHRDLELVVGLGAPPRDDEAEEPAEAEVDEGEGHGR